MYNSTLIIPMNQMLFRISSTSWIVSSKAILDSVEPIKINTISANMRAKLKQSQNIKKVVLGDKNAGF